MPDDNRIAELYNELVLTAAAHILEENAVKDFDDAQATDVPYDRPELDENLRQLISAHRRRQRHKSALAAANVVAKRAAVVVLVFLLTASVAYLTVEAFRQRVNNLFTHEEKQYMQFGAQADMADAKAAGFVCAPTVLPEGYRLDKMTADANMMWLSYVNAGGDTILFQQFRNSQMLSLDNEHEKQSINIGGNQGYYTITDDFVTLVWEQNGLFYAVSGSIDIVAAKKIAESVQPL